MMFDLPTASSPSNVGVAEPKCHTTNLALFSDADTAPRRAIASARVLLADDNYFSRQKLAEAFKRTRDFIVCGEAVNGRDAIKAAQLLRPDLIVLDLVMPAMNGLVAARKRLSDSCRQCLSSSMAAWTSS